MAEIFGQRIRWMERESDLQQTAGETGISATSLSRLETEAVCPSPKAAELFTIGYEGRNLKSYLDILSKASITLLCDVRRNPISRKNGFSKSSLASGCEEAEIRYEHLPELGITSEKRRNLKKREDYDKLLREYEKKRLPKQNEALSKILAWMRSGERVALTCYERQPEQCRRLCIAEAIARKAGEQVVPKHLL